MVRFDVSMSRRFTRLRGLLVKQIEALALQLYCSRSPEQNTAVCSGIEQASAQDKALLAENISLFMLSWIGHSELSLEVAESTRFLHEGVYRVFYQLGMFFKNNEGFLERCKELRLEAIAADIKNLY